MLRYGTTNLCVRLLYKRKATTLQSNFNFANIGKYEKADEGHVLLLNCEVCWRNNEWCNAQ